MEQGEANSRTPFSAEPGQQVQPLPSDTKIDNTSSPEMEPIESMPLATAMDTPMGNAPGPVSGLGLGGASGVQQPKVQTAFIHKLYNMLEDGNIQHLISWSSSNESFVVSPTGEFSKVLSQYFKHTNISSFVRQLNMYGFHKVNDVFHTGSPDSTLWEFKHGNGSFKRGDLVGLREIKRRASRHALIHRDSFSGTKSAVASQPGTPGGEQPQDTVDNRLGVIEQTLFEINNRLNRSEETNVLLMSKYQLAIEGLTRCHQWTIELSQVMTNLATPEHGPIIHQIQSMQKEIERHTALLEDSDILRQPFLSSLSIDNSAPLSPRQRPAEDESRRSSFSGQLRPGGYFRTPAPPPIPNPPRRFGSVGIGSSSPNALRPQHPPQQPPQQHPLVSSYHSSPSHLSRRHTSADIRLHGWQASSPFSGIGQSSHWPPSPNRTPNPPDNPREAMANYDIQQHRPANSLFSMQTTPPLSETTPNGTESGWNFGGKFPPAREAGHTAPPTRRSSMVSSSVHALLNPTDSAGDRDGISDGEPDDRKRKRLQ
ncbi:Flocculation suppression protein [Rhizina undulata]